jgi:hypothetical protein
MMMSSVTRWLLVPLLLAAAPAMATFTLVNSNGGDGYVVLDPLVPGKFTLWSADNGDELDGGENLTTYGTTANGRRTYTVRWSHVTEDTSANWDPGGWFRNDAFFPLTNDDVPTGVVQSGRLQFTVNRGDVWGFYVYTTDGCCGRGALTISTVPEPASWAMLIAGFGLTGAVMRRRKPVAAA